MNEEVEVLVELLTDVLGEPHQHYESRGQISFDCPVCSYDIKQLERGDGKGNLEINYKRGVYKCWSCAETHETHGSIFKLVKKYGTPRQNKKFLLLMPEEVEDVKRTYKRVHLPKEFISFKEVSQGLKLTPQFKQAWNYIKKRNITDEMIEKFKDKTYVLDKLLGGPIEINQQYAKQLKEIIDNPMIKLAMSI